MPGLRCLWDQPCFRNLVASATAACAGWPREGYGEFAALGGGLGNIEFQRLGVCRAVVDWLDHDRVVGYDADGGSVVFATVGDAETVVQRWVKMVIAEP